MKKEHSKRENIRINIFLKKESLKNDNYENVNLKKDNYGKGRL